MKKFLLITTCAAALSALAAIGASQPGLAQQTDQQKHETPAAERPAAKAPAETQTKKPMAKPDAMNNEKPAAEDKAKQPAKAAEEKPEHREKAVEDKTEHREKAVEDKTAKPKAGEAAAKDTKPEPKESAQEKKDVPHQNEANQRRELDEHQVSDLRERLHKEGRASQTNVNFDVRIGVDVPESVTLVEVPDDIIVEYPQFRGYDYVMVQDEIVIVDPQSRAVVEVVGGPPSMRAAAVNPCTTNQ